MARKILITGAGGQLGLAIHQKLSDKFDVFPTDRITSESKLIRSSKILDITDRIDVETIINEINPDIIINCGALTDVDYCDENHKHCHDVNVSGLNKLIAWWSVGGYGV